MPSSGFYGHCMPRHQAGHTPIYIKINKLEIKIVWHCVIGILELGVEDLPRWFLHLSISSSP